MIIALVKAWEDDVSSAAYAQAVTALAATTGGRTDHFNDAPGRTDDECFDAFVSAEKALREQAAR